MYVPLLLKIMICLQWIVLKKKYMMKNLNRSYKILEKKFCLKKIVVLKESIANFKKMSRHKSALKS